MKPHILGISASLRNARAHVGSQELMSELAAVGDRDSLDEYLSAQAKIHLDQFVAAGRAENLPFDQIYRRLQALGGRRGLSNSEVCLVAALWGARETGADVGHVSLSDHFRADGSSIALDALKAMLRAADGIIVATPVYFGDRSSLAERLIEMIRSDDALRRQLAGKVYAGVAVGAKRNGGQETTLIYQMLDLLGTGLLGVGNDSETTSQYGGTAHAGDIGTAPTDGYGINTSIGTGRRIARVAGQLAAGIGTALVDKPNVGLWLLQDRAGMLLETLDPLLEPVRKTASLEVIDLLGERIRPCLACDICPTHVGPDEEYRCIIARRDDGLKKAHDALLRPDIVVPAMYSPRSRKGLRTVYQEFMERTRYLRRGDYVYTDRLVVPLVLAEVGSDEHLEIRMMTSFLRHHTVMFKPIVGLIHDGRLINADDVEHGLVDAIEQGTRLLVGRLSSISLDAAATAYKPVGYVLAQAKDQEESILSAREHAIAGRHRRLVEDARRRLEDIETGTAGVA